MLNGVVIVSYFNALRSQGLDAHGAAVTGSLVRFRTVLMTALLAMLLPAIYTLIEGGRRKVSL